MKKLRKIFALFVFVVLTFMVVNVTQATGRDKDYKRQRAEEARKIQERILSMDPRSKLPVVQERYNSKDFALIVPLARNYQDVLQDLVRAWTIGSLQFGADNYNKNIKRNRPWFTEQGWGHYQKYLSDNSINEWLDEASGAFFVSTISAPVMVEQKIKKKGVEWLFSTDIRLEAYSNKTRLSKSANHKALIKLTYVSKGDIHISRIKFVDNKVLSGDIDKLDDYDENNISETATKYLREALTLDRNFDSEARLFKAYIRSLSLEMLLSSIQSVSLKSDEIGVSSIRSWFTQKGWREFNSFLKKSDLHNIREGLSISLLETPMSLRSGNILGFSVHGVSIPVMFQYNDGVKQISKKKKVKIYMAETLAQSKVYKIFSVDSKRQIRFDKPKTQFDNMSSKEMEAFLRARCEDKKHCKTSYPEALILSKKKTQERKCLYREKTKDKRAYIPDLDIELPCFMIVNLDIQSWTPSKDLITLQLKADKATELQEVTTSHRGHKVALFYGHTFLTAPVIMEIVDSGYISLPMDPALATHLKKNVREKAQ